ncbi:MAG: ATP-binding cassette domain-containing protein [Verrucomicrobiaceae bacterium]|nr:ATP-binding cassette domain-containing protein [Verrucomicrobiaceae bacterium]
MINIKDLSVRAGDFRLSNVNLRVPKSAYAVLMGKTGCGKTTLLECVCGLKRAVAGSIYFDDHEVTNLRPAERGVGYVPQDGAIFSTMKVSDQLAFGPSVRGWEKSEAKLRSEEIADELGIGYLMNRYPAGLSGGERQRIALGRALSCRPQVLCLDEPLSALDDDTKDEICELIERLRRNHPFTALHITHSRAEAERLGDMIFKIEGNDCLLVEGQAN